MSFWTWKNASLSLKVRNYFITSYNKLQFNIHNQYTCICKTQIDVQSLIDVQSSNTCPIYTSQTSVPQIYSQIGVQRCHWCMLQMTSYLLGEVFEGMMEKLLKSYCVYSGPIDCNLNNHQITKKTSWNNRLKNMQNKTIITIISQFTVSHFCFYFFFY